jgi:hypothetical protein
MRLRENSTQPAIGDQQAATGNRQEEWRAGPFGPTRLPEALLRWCLLL